MGANSDSNSSVSGSKRFTSFGGVFTPNVLTILGVILFLRAGWVVGNVGLMGAVTIIVIANLISLATGLSLSAIATSMDVKAGGNYYMISHTLGLEVGGSIGIPLYFSQALSVAFYIIGFTEGVLWIFPQLNPVIIASATCFILSVLAFSGASWVIKVQYVILAVLGLSLLSFFSGGTGSYHQITFWQQSGVEFWAVFAIYFPAVTGIEVGVSMSGDLKDPQSSIPRGTLWAIAVTFAVYLAQAGWLSLNATSQELVNNPMIMKSIARWPFLVTAGLAAATISSALGCIMAAPRTMQALAQDRILPKFLAKGAKKTNEPRIATIITFILAETCILMGGLDVVAPIITMFFLNTYAVVNMVAVLENLVGNPSYRPNFTVHWLISLAGAIACYVTMFLINSSATIVAIIITLGLFFYLSKKEFQARWGDVRGGFWFSLARFAILRLEKFEPHPLNWRPDALVFAGNPHTRRPLIRVANWLSKGKGLITLCQLLVGEESKLLLQRQSAQKRLDGFIRKNNLHALGYAHLASSFREGAKQVVQAYGMGQFKSNLVLLGWCGQTEREVEFAKLLRELYQLEKSVLAMNILDDQNVFGRYKQIDVWWSGMQKNGKLMLLIAHLISKNSEWEGSKITLNMVIKNAQARQKTKTNLENLLKQAHIEAKVNVVVPDTPKVKIPYIIRKFSQESDLVILGMMVPEEGKEKDFMERMFLFLAGLPTTLLVKSVEDIDLII